MSGGIDIYRDTISEPGQTGQETVGLTAVQIADTVERDLFTGVTIKADAANADAIYIGFGASVSTSSGFKLAPGDEQTVPVALLAMLWFISGTTDQEMSWIAL